jgi:hypothetical protein
VRRLVVTTNVVPSSPILVTLMKEALISSESSVLTRATWRNIPEDAILDLVYYNLIRQLFTELFCKIGGFHGGDYENSVF